jgi:hypothetical protein
LKIGRLVVGIIVFALNAKGQNDSSLFHKGEVKDSLSKISLSITSGISLPVNSYLHSGPATSAEFGIPIKASYFGIDVKATYMLNKLVGNDGFSIITISQKQINLFVGPSFTLPINRFSINIGLMVGVNQEGEESLQAIYEIELYIKYLITPKWFLKINGEFLDLISSYYNPVQYFNIACGIGYNF